MKKREYNGETNDEYQKKNTPRKYSCNVIKIYKEKMSAWSEKGIE